MITINESVLDNFLLPILNELGVKYNQEFNLLDIDLIPESEWINSKFYSNPNNIHTPLVGGQVRYTEYKTFYIRLHFNNDSLRHQKEAFFDEFKEIIHKKNLNYEMPQDGRDWKEISINGGVYPIKKQTDNSFIDYLIPIRIIYIN